MPDILARLDLNLLVALDALLSEKSVSGAARKLGLSQPALSSALGKLRRHFGDELLERRGNSYQHSALAQRLAEEVSIAMHQTRRVFATRGMWDPATSQREFLLYGSDYAISTVGAHAARILADETSNISLRFELNTPEVVDRASEVMRTADGILIPYGHVHGLEALDLWQDEWVIVADPEHPTIGEHLVLSDLEENPWVASFSSHTAFTAISRQLREMGIERTVDVTIQSFLSVPSFVLGTNRLGLMQRTLAESMRNLRLLALPIEALPVKNALWWHGVHREDPGHQWLRELFVRAAQEL